MAGICVGNLFPTYSDFESQLKRYKNDKFVDFSITDCRTLHAALKRCPNIIEKIPEAVKYYYVKLQCVQGGNYKVKKGNKARRMTSTLKQDCKAFIYLKVDEATCQLKVTKMNEEHNHDISESLFRHLPSQRRLSPERKQEVYELLELKANKKLVQEKMFQTTGKIITLRDLSNISVTGKNSHSNKSLEQVVHELKSKHNCDVHILTDAKRNFKALFIQDERMKAFYNAYPQLLFADSTFKLLDLRIPVFVLMAEDGNGQSEVVALGLLYREDKDTVKWFFEIFRSLNETSAPNTVVVMTDKDLAERAVIREVYPDAFLRICLFHVFRAFNREITCTKMGITPSQRDLAKELLQKICYAPTIEEYEKISQLLQDTTEKSVWEYFNTNWNNIKEEWSSIPSFNIATYLNSTNNRIESFNSKLKSVCTYFASLDKFIQNMFIVLRSLRTERDHVSSQVLLKKPTKPLANPEEEIFFHVLTPYAFLKVKEQLELSINLDVENIAYGVTETTCSCKFMFSMCLPCKHIFAYRRKHDLSIFDDRLYAERWTLEYFTNNLTMLNGELLQKTVKSTGISVIEPSKKILSTQEKFRKAVIITDQLAAITAEKSQTFFEKRLQFLEDVYKLWSEGKELTITEKTETDSQMSLEFDSVEHSVPEQIAEDNEEININSVTTAEKNENSEEEFIRSITMPPKVQMKGRPKGATLTVVGLPKKNRSKKLSFVKKSYLEKRDILLSWFLDSQTIDKIKKDNYLVEESDIESKPENISSAVLHEAVDINLIRCFFTLDGWNMLKAVIESKKQNHTLVCPACSGDIGVESIVVCSLCLLTHHSKCVGLKVAPKKRQWYCHQCQSI